MTKRGPYRHRPPLERFWPKVNKTDTCWIWTASKTRNGYGQFYDDHRLHAAHRWLYEQMVALVPQHLDLDHLCRIRACVNPGHLEPVTRKENARRGLTGVMLTHCKYGHPRIPETLYTNPTTGLRDCRVCRHIRNLQRRKSASR